MKKRIRKKYTKRSCVCCHRLGFLFDNFGGPVCGVLSCKSCCDCKMFYPNISYKEKKIEKKITAKTRYNYYKGEEIDFGQFRNNYANNNYYE